LYSSSLVFDYVVKQDLHNFFIPVDEIQQSEKYKDLFFKQFVDFVSYCYRRRIFTIQTTTRKDEKSYSSIGLYSETAISFLLIHKEHSKIRRIQSKVLFVVKCHDCQHFFFILSLFGRHYLIFNRHSFVITIVK
jgi:hypothetical protein